MSNIPKTLVEFERAVVEDFAYLLDKARELEIDTKVLEESLDQMLEPGRRHRALVQKLAIVSPYGFPLPIS